MSGKAFGAFPVLVSQDCHGLLGDSSGGMGGCYHSVLRAAAEKEQRKTLCLHLNNM